MYRFCLNAMFFLFFSFIISEDYLGLISKYANNPVKVYSELSQVKNLGYSGCDFLNNGESFVIKSFIKKDHVVFDIGAFIGEWSDFVLKFTKCHCRLYSFEPVFDSYKKLALLKSSYDNFHSYNLAIGREDANVEMNYFFEKGSDCSTLFNRPILSHVPSKKINIKMTYLDKFASENNIEHINFLKIDSEGSEYDVLLGANDLIENNKINIIQFEYGGTYLDANITLNQVYNFLRKNNYLIFRIVSTGLVYIPNWDEKLEDFQYSNYLAFHIN